LLQGLTLDPDRAFDTAGELHEWGDMNPEVEASAQFSHAEFQKARMGIDRGEAAHRVD